MLRSIPSSVLKELVKLSERREAHLAQIQAIDRQINGVQKRFGIPYRETPEIRPITFSAKPSSRPRSKRGVLRDKIIAALRGCGRKGATVRELSKKLRVPPSNLYVWFNGTGRNVPKIRKTGPARYRLD